MKEMKNVVLLRRLMIIVLFSFILLVGQASARQHDFAYQFDLPGNGPLGDATKAMQNIITGALTGIVLIGVFVAFVASVNGIVGGGTAVMIFYFLFIEVPSKIGPRPGYLWFCIGFVVLALILLWLTIGKLPKNPFRRKDKAYSGAASGKKKKGGCPGKTLRHKC